MPLPAIRVITRADVDRTADAMQREGWGDRRIKTALGLPLYEGLGFEVQTWYRIMEAPGLAGGSEDSRARPFRPSDLSTMRALDSAATGEDRGHLLAAFAGPDTTLCVDRADGTLGGFVVRASWGGGATIAPDREDALAIVGARRLAAGLELLADAGWADAWQPRGSSADRCRTGTRARSGGSSTTRSAEPGGMGRKSRSRLSRRFPWHDPMGSWSCPDYPVMLVPRRTRMDERKLRNDDRNSLPPVWNARRWQRR